MSWQEVELRQQCKLRSMAVNPDEASLIHPLLTSCYMALAPNRPCNGSIDPWARRWGPLPEQLREAFPKTSKWTPTTRPLYLGNVMCHTDCVSDSFMTFIPSFLFLSIYQKAESLPSPQGHHTSPLPDLFTLDVRCCPGACFESNDEKCWLLVAISTREACW